MKDSILLVACFCLLFACAATVQADDGAEHRVQQTPPVLMGTSGGSADDIGSAFCCGGTLGALVLYDGVDHILSNNHILARSGSAIVGEDAVQPGLIDTGCRPTGNIVGTFIGDVVPLGSANVDAALSMAIDGMVDASGAILDVGVPCAETQAPTIGLAVTKSGRTTGQTWGQITAINATVSIKYRPSCNQGKGFTITSYNQVVTGDMSDSGDSGALLVSDDGTPNPVGLLFAGSSATTIFNPIQDVVDAFTNGGHTFSFVGNSCGAAAAATDVVTPSDIDIEAARRVKQQNEHNLFRIPGVLGVGIGAADDDPQEAAIVVFVESPSGKIPRAIPTELDGTTVKVILTDPIVAR